MFVILASVRYSVSALLVGLQGVSQARSGVGIVGKPYQHPGREKWRPAYGLHPRRFPDPNRTKGEMAIKTPCFDNEKRLMYDAGCTLESERERENRDVFIIFPRPHNPPEVESADPALVPSCQIRPRTPPHNNGRAPSPAGGRYSTMKTVEVAQHSCHSRRNGRKIVVENRKSPVE